jgi:hypothetical protein
VYSNRTGSIVDGIPAHGVWVIVEGGESNRIGETIYNNVPPGIPIKQGAESVIITKQNGSTETVYYDTPTAATLYIRGYIKSFDGTLDTTYIINQLIEQLDYNIGERADSATITAILKEIIADTGTVYGIELSLTSDFATPAEYLTPTGLDEFLQATSSSVTLTPV